MMYSKSTISSIAKYKVNTVIKVLIISDFLFWSANQLLMPFFAIFVTQKIHGGSVEVIGVATALYFIFKSIFEIPVGIYIDRSKSEKDDLYTSLWGGVLVAMVYFSFMFISSVPALFALQAIMGVAAALGYPGWCSIFTRHIDSGKEGFEWSLYDIVLGLGIASAAVIGGFVIERHGFNVLFIIIGIITLMSSFILFAIKDKIYKK